LFSGIVNIQILSQRSIRKKKLEIIHKKIFDAMVKVEFVSVVVGVGWSSSASLGFILFLVEESFHTFKS
jgi:hypothetical protein